MVTINAICIAGLGSGAGSKGSNPQNFSVYPQVTDKGYTLDGRLSGYRKPDCGP
jgi:hypothetical protein